MQSRIAGLVAGGLLVAGLGGVAVQTAHADDGDAGEKGLGTSGGAQRVDREATPTVRLAASEVRGTFTFACDEVDANAKVGAAFRAADAALCHLPGAQDGIAGRSGRVVVGGSASGRAFEATVEQLKAACGESRHVLTCACTANPAGGSAIATAEVSGVSLADIAQRAGIDTACFGAAWNALTA